METIIVYIDWCHKNFSASFSENVPGGVAFTADTYDNILLEAQKTLDFHLQGYVEDGEAPQWYLDKNYKLEFQPTAAALLHSLSSDITLASISRATGINQTQLGHYLHGRSRPSRKTIDKIQNGIRKFVKDLTVVNFA